MFYAILFLIMMLDNDTIVPGPAPGHFEGIAPAVSPPTLTAVRYGERLTFTWDTDITLSQSSLLSLQLPVSL